MGFEWFWLGERGRGRESGESRERGRPGEMRESEMEIFISYISTHTLILGHTLITLALPQITILAH